MNAHDFIHANGLPQLGQTVYIARNEGHETKYSLATIAKVSSTGKRIETVTLDNDHRRVFHNGDEQGHRDSWRRGPWLEFDVDRVRTIIMQRARGRKVSDALRAIAEATKDFGRYNHDVEYTLKQLETVKAQIAEAQALVMQPYL